MHQEVYAEICGLPQRPRHELLYIFPLSVSHRTAMRASFSPFALCFLVPIFFAPAAHVLGQTNHGRTQEATSDRSSAESTVGVAFSAGEREVRALAASVGVHEGTAFWFSFVLAPWAALGLLPSPPASPSYL